MHGAARTVAAPRAALAAAALFACCDAFLFAIGTARNDALPAACLAWALALAVRAERHGASRWSALVTGLLLAAATAAKISYAFPAMVYGLWTLARPRHRPAWVALGALPAIALVTWTYALSPAGFRFGVFTFPALAPADYYAGHPWKLSIAAKLLDTLKFLALGPALLAVALVMVRRRVPAMLFLLVLAGLVAAMLPTPIWRQYLVPMLPPLFVMLAVRWTQAPPGVTVRTLAGVFALAGLAPTAIALASGRPAMIRAMQEGAAIRRTLDQIGLPSTEKISTLSPQFLPAAGRSPDPVFATGPFFFRSHGLVPFEQEAALNVISRTTLPRMSWTAAVLVGGEGAWTSGDPALERALERWAQARGYERHVVPGTPFRLYVSPPVNF